MKRHISLSVGLIMALVPVLTNAQSMDAVGGSGYVCPALARLCPDGSTVSAQGPNCTFTCPSDAATSTSSGFPITGLCLRFTRSMGVGTQGDDVSQLQLYLASQGIYSGPRTGYFGPLTQQAVKTWQAQQNIAQTGVVGVLSRAAFAQTCSLPPVMNTGTTSVATTTASTSIKIISMMPNSGPVGTKVSLMGIGFTSDNTVHFGASIIPHVAGVVNDAQTCPAPDSDTCAPGLRKIITVTIPQMSMPPCIYSQPRCMIAQMLTVPGVYKIWVENATGVSRAFDFTVSTSTPAATL